MEKTMTDTIHFSSINKIPALTWNWLKMNRDSLSIGRAPSVKQPVVGEIPEGAAFIERGAIDLASFPALSFGIGAELSDYLEQNVFKGVDQIIHIRGKLAAPLVLRFSYGADDSPSASAQILYASRDSEGTVIFVYEGDSSDDGAADDSAENPSDAPTDSFVRTKIYAEENAKIHVVKVQLLGKSHNQADDTAAVALENAEIHFTQIELGGKHVNVALRTELFGRKARLKSELAFICAGNQRLDINHESVHTGSETDTKMLVKGVVDGSAVKTYRGTIDFRHGCAGAMGDEQEETLLMSKTAVNKSIPVILCDEENVSGTHGATLGRLGADELFYMQSRGISEDEAKKMMTRAKVLSVAALVESEVVRDQIAAFLGEG